jgi:PAS domain S-box-containing protein
LGEILSAFEAISNGEGDSLYRQIIDQMHEGVWMLDSDARVTFVNQQLAAMIGQTPEQMRGRGAMDFFWPEDVQLGQTHCRRVLQGETGLQFECRLRHRDGQAIWCRINCGPLRAAERKTIGLVGTFTSINTAKQQEQLQRDDERRYRLLAESMLHGVVHQDVSGRVIGMNPAAQRMLGLSPAELPGALANVKPTDTLHEDGTPMLRQDHPSRVALRTGQPVRGVLMGIYNAREKAHRWIRVDAIPVVREGESQPAEIYTVFEDVTDWRKTQQALKESQQQNEFLADLIRASSQPMAIGYPDGTLGLVNRAFEELTGYTEEELRSISWVTKLTPEEYHAFEEAKLAEQRSHGRPIRYEKEYIRKDGTRVPIELLVHMVPGPDGEPKFYYSFLNDITERRRAEQELRDSEQRMRLATEATAVGIWEWNVITNQIHWDAQMFRIYGIDPTRDGFVIYQTWAGAVVPEDLSEQERQLQETIRQRGHGAREFRIQRAHDGAIRHIQAVETVRVNAAGEAQWVVGTNLDITARKEDEERLKQLVALAERRSGELAAAKSAAEAANNAKDHFLAVLSHELRTPLTPVLAMSMMLEGEPGLAPAHREMIQTIRRNVELEARLIDDLLDITRITRNKLELNVRRVDVHKKIENVIAICADDAAAKSISVKAKLQAASHNIDGDPARLQQVIWNLLKNATKFTPDSGEICISTSNPAPGRLRITVSDTGIGIDPEALPRIFDAFEQGGREVTRRFGGLGLGLAIAKALVEMHGGTIAAYSPGIGRGATFCVEVNAVEPEAAASPQPQTPQLPQIRCRILLVEDHQDTRRVMARLLRNMGCTVEAVESIADALNRVAAQQFDLLISDIGLPDGSGTELMQRVKGSGMRGIALSGYGMDEDLARSAQAGFDVHLTKPVNIDELAAVIRRVLGQEAAG